MTDARTAPETGSVLLQLKVRLPGISPMIWRHVLVPDAMSLHELHGVLQVAMGWEAILLFQFSVRGVVYAGPCLHGQPVDVPAFRTSGLAGTQSFVTSTTWGAGGSTS